MSPKLPTLVIVGRPNVGKSTLFNRIVGRRVAVVEDTPGVTRDRLYAEAEWNNKQFTVVDTGGILYNEDDPLIEQIRVQAQVAIAEADVVMFVVDAVAGLHGDDQELAKRLRGLKAPLILVANKADNVAREHMANEFYALGMGEVYAISALHGSGLSEAMDEICAHFPKSKRGEDEKEELRLAIVGRPNVGKSSLLNAFTGEQRAIVSNIPGTTRDAIDTLVQFQGEPFRLIDTAGIRRRGKIQGSIEYYMVLRATQAIERADCALVVIDASEGLTDGDKRIAKAAHDMGKACVLCVNKWDLKEPDEFRTKRRTPLRKDFERIVRNEIPELSYAPVCMISAKESAGLESVMKTVLQAVEAWNFRISTGRLVRLIQDATFERPYTSKGRNLKVYYATQVQARPPTFVLFCNDAELMHFSYQRYLENRIRKELPLIGTPVRIVARSSKRKDEQG